MIDRDDPVTFELIRHALATVGDEMARTMVRCAYSPIVRNSNDYTTGILNRDGEIIGQGNNPIHLRSLMDATAAVKRTFEPLVDGDVFIVNDPYNGGSHLPDVFLIKPVFYGDQLVGFSGSEAHHADIGGRVVGSNAADSRELFEEGLIIPPSYLFRGGRRETTMWELFKRNSRFPALVEGDLGAQLTAVEVGASELSNLLDRYGVESFFRYVESILDYSETLTRREISAWPDGNYEHTDYIDDDGISDSPIPVRVRVTVKGSDVTVDFTGSGSQVQTAINNPGQFTASAAMAALRCMMADEIPHNSGFLRPISVHVPRGSILNPEPPAAVSARTLSAFHAFEATITCLSQFVPGRAMAGTHCSNALITFSGFRPNGERFIFADIHFGSWGARADSDGLDGMCSPLVTISNTPVEVIESEFPIRVTKYALEPDSGGAGRFRGGLAVSREYLAEVPMTVEVRSDRARISPPGLEGGGEGTVGSTVIERADGTREVTPARMRRELEPNDRISSTLASGGGWGDPLDREPALVGQDVRNGRMTTETASRVFGVTMNSDGTVDIPATESLRSGR